MFPIVNSSGDAFDCDQVLDSDNYRRDQTEIEIKFLRFTKDQQIHIVQGLLQHMSHYQHGQIDCYLKPMLQRDFITDLPAKGLFQVSEQILVYLDAKSLCAASQVSNSWRYVIREGYLWKKLIEHQVMTDSLWRGLGERMTWINKLRIPGQHIHPRSPRNRIFKSGSDSSGIYSNNNRTNQILSHGSSNSGMDSYMNGVSEFLEDNSIIAGYELMDPDYYRHLYPEIIVNIKRIQKHWLNGKYTLRKIECHSESSKGVYCLQYDDKKIVSGLRDNSIKVWDARTLECVRILTGHVGSVLCLQYDENVIISGSSDSTVRVWSLSTWACVSTIYHHCEAVLHLRFAHGILVTCSKDRSIAVWDMFAASDIRLRRVLVGHRAAVNVVDFDQKNIVSASGDRTIKVWNTQTCEFLHTMNGHRRGIACLQYRNNLVVSGSSDNTIRLWQIETGTCLRTLEGHEELVRCIRFDSKYIVSGAYDGKIKVWDLVAALNPQSPSNILCLQTLNQHTGRVFRLQFDEFQIVSSSHDDTILIWDFLDTNSSQEADMTVVRSPVISLDNEDDHSQGTRILNHSTTDQNIVLDDDTSPQEYGSMMISNDGEGTAAYNIASSTANRSLSNFNVSTSRKHHRTPSKYNVVDQRTAQSDDSLNDSRMRPTNFVYFDSNQTSVTSDQDDDTPRGTDKVYKSKYHTRKMS